MNLEQAKKEYENRFGGFPEFLFMGADSEVIVEAVKKALKSGEEIEAPNMESVY